MCPKGKYVSHKCNSLNCHISTIFFYLFYSGRCHIWPLYARSSMFPGLVYDLITYVWSPRLVVCLALVLQPPVYVVFLVRRCSDHEALVDLLVNLMKHSVIVKQTVNNLRCHEWNQTQIVATSLVDVTNTCFNRSLNAASNLLAFSRYSWLGGWCTGRAESKNVSNVSELIVKSKL